MNKTRILYLLLSGALGACTGRTDAPLANNISHNYLVYFTPGPDCENAIVAQIETAKTMRIAVYSITNPVIGDAIIAAHNRGADIKIISDRTQAKNKASLIDAFRAANIPVVLNRGHKIEHNKFAVFDNKTIVTGSYNWTTNATKYNSENCIIQTGLAPEYAARFDELWNKYTNN